jgi:hypothetical protein
MLKVVFQQMRASPFSAMEIKSRLDLTEIFCDVDDFCRSFEQHCHSILQLTAITGEKRCPKGYTQCDKCKPLRILLAYESKRGDDHRHCLSWQWLQNV